MNESALQAVARSPATFREALIIPGVRGPARFGDLMADFQRQDFEALDRGFLALRAGKPPTPNRYWLERTKGASKDTDLAVMLLWLLAFTPRALTCQVGAADADQADELRKAAKAISRLNTWLAATIEVQAWTINNAATESRCDIIPADEAGSHGARPDLLILNELTHVTKREFAENLLDNASKVPLGIVVCVMNAGHLGTWQWDWREAARASERWHFSAFTGTAPWLDPAELAEAKRRNSPNRYARLWEGQWVANSGDALAEADLMDAVDPKLEALEKAETGWAYAGGLDLGLKRDAAAFVIIGKSRSGRYRLARVWTWRPTVTRKVDLMAVEAAIREAYKLFRWRAAILDPWQGDYLMTRLRAVGIPFELERTGEQGQDEKARHLINQFTEHNVKLFDHGPLTTELRQMSILEKASGKLKLEHPRTQDGHGDHAAAFALSLLAGRQIEHGFGDDHAPRIAISGCATYGRDPLLSLLYGRGRSLW